jgi:hypothetical protein
MATITVDSLKGTTHIRGRPYTMYTGYMTPNQLIQYCDVPSYSRVQSHVSIANGLKQAPIDNWQRPLDVKRLGDIADSIDRAIPADNSKDSLMANPVLIGRSDQLAQPGVSMHINQKTIPSGAMSIPVPDMWSLDFTESNGRKPLWILDGQHRIHGMGNSPHVLDVNGNQIFNGSHAENELIPVVFIIDAGYQPKFLAKIFTEVTTESRSMEPLHSDWMRYAFELGDYNESEEALLAMKAVIELASIQDIDNSPNPFYDRIKFNPHHPITPVSAFRKLTAKKLREMIEDSFYKQYDGPNDPIPGNLPQDWPTPVQLATSIVRFYRACIQTDGLALTTSKLFGPNDGYELLADTFMSEFFKFLGADINRPLIVHNTLQDWVDFVTEPARLFHTADWSLPNVIVGGNETNAARASSKKASQLTFENFFCNPAGFGGVDPAAWLQGPGEIYIEHCPLGPRFRANQAIGSSHMAGGGAGRVNTPRPNGHKMIRFSAPPSSQASITRIERMINGVWTQVITKNSITLTPGPAASDQIKVTTLCYTDSSEQVNTYTVLS